MTQHSVTLASPTDLSGFRREARALLSALVPPEDANWDARAMTEPHCSFRHAQRMADDRPQGGVNPVLPRSFLSLCNLVILHHDPSRFELLYRLLWRLVHEPGLNRDPHDRDRLRALHMARAVRRDMQRMKSQVRFRIVRSAQDGETLQIAWFAPDHYVLEAAAPFFMRRMAHSLWAILTPEESIRGHGESLELAPGVDCKNGLDRDAPEARWLECYHQAFSPNALRSGRDSEPARSSRPDSVP